MAQACNWVSECSEAHATSYVERKLRLFTIKVKVVPYNCIQHLSKHETLIFYFNCFEGE